MHPAAPVLFSSFKRSAKDNSQEMAQKLIRERREDIEREKAIKADRRAAFEEKKAPLVSEKTLKATKDVKALSYNSDTNALLGVRKKSFVERPATKSTSKNTVVIEYQEIINKNRMTREDFKEYITGTFESISFDQLRQEKRNKIWLAYTTIDADGSQYYSKGGYYVGLGPRSLCIGTQPHSINLNEFFKDRYGNEGNSIFQWYVKLKPELKIYKRVTFDELAEKYRKIKKAYKDLADKVKAQQQQK
jgi:hypothetical protein